MFASFISFRDFTLYVIPGNITVYLFLKLLSLNNITPFPYFVQGTSTNIGLLVIFAAVSTCIGFIQSQVIITAFNWFIKKSKKNPYLLNNLGIDTTLYANTIAKMKATFQLSDDFIISQSHFVFCNSFVLSRTDEHSYGYARRLVNFSLFSTVIPVPFSLSLYYLFVKLHIPLFWHWTLFIVFSIAIFIYCYKMTKHFRCLWVRNVLSLFLTLPQDKADDK
jgi:hypothetical protein